MNDDATPAKVRLTDGLGPLLPTREGQPHTLTMTMPWEHELGHWYSPAAVQMRVDAAVAAEGERWRQAIEPVLTANEGELPHAIYVLAGFARA